MELIKVGDVYEAHTSYEERAIPKSAGFRWNPNIKRWTTNKVEVAAKLREYASGPTKASLTRVDNARKDAFAASSATDSTADIPKPDGLEYLPYQRAGIEFSLGKDAVLIGDEMGLGKTIQALGIINATPKAKRVLIIVPASLRLNWQREAEKWLVNKGLSIGIAIGSKWPDTDIVIINYDILTKHKAQLRKRVWDVLICDEAHYLKNPKANRTKQVFGDWRYKTKEWKIDPLKAKRRVLLTGTPIVNRPIELWGLANYLDPDEFDNFFRYAKRYANAHHNGWGWDFSGAANLDELQEKLRTRFLVRRLKKDVLKDLPAKRRQIIELPANGATGLIAREQAAWSAQEERLAALRLAVDLSKISEDPEEYERAVAALRDGATAAFEEMSRARHDTALAKVDYVIDHVADAAESGKVLVFAHHLDVVAKLAEGLRAKDFKVVTLTGSDSLTARQAAVDSFQDDDEVKIFIGNIRAAGVGITLTASSHVVFAELDWVPANLSQAEDRAHRIGQTDSVLVQHLVLEGSLDQQIANQLVAKQAVIDATLDGEIDLEFKVPTIPGHDGVPEEADAISFTEIKKFEKGHDITAEQQAAIHECLRILAGVCDGASSRDGEGFNGVDTSFGHSLAVQPSLSAKQAHFGQKIIRKYHRQLPASLLTAAG